MSAVLTVMPTASAVTMQDLEAEDAELLPARETLWVCDKLLPRYGRGHGPYWRT